MNRSVKVLEREVVVEASVHVYILFQVCVYVRVSVIKKIMGNSTAAAQIFTKFHLSDQKMTAVATDPYILGHLC